MALTLTNKIGYGMGAMTESNFQNQLNMLLSLIMFNSLGLISPVKIGWIIAITRVWDTITDPLMGYISDNTKSRWGKRKPYLIIGSVFTALAFFGTWMFPTGKPEGFYFFYLLIFGILYYTGTTIFCVPYISFGYELTTDYHERTKLMGFRSLFVNFGSMLLNWAWPFTLLKCFGNPLNGVRVLAIVSGILYILMAMGPVFLTPKASELPVAKLSENAEEKSSIRDLFGAFTIKPFILLVITLGVSVAGLFLSSTFGANVNIYYVCQGNKNFAGTLMGVSATIGTVVNFLNIPFTTWVSKKMDKPKALIFFLVFAGLGALSGFYLYTPKCPWLMPFCGLPLGMGISALWMILFSMIPDVCDYDLLVNNRKRQGIFAAIISWVTKLGYSVCCVFAGYFLEWSGFVLDNGANQSDRVFLNMRLFNSLLPAAGLLLAAVIVFLYPLNQKKVAEIQAELKAKNAESVPSTSTRARASRFRGRIQGKKHRRRIPS